MPDQLLKNLAEKPPEPAQLTVENLKIRQRIEKLKKYMEFYQCVRIPVELITKLKSEDLNSQYLIVCQDHKKNWYIYNTVPANPDLHYGLEDYSRVKKIMDLLEHNDLIFLNAPTNRGKTHITFADLIKKYTEAGIKCSQKTMSPVSSEETYSEQRKQEIIEQTYESLKNYDIILLDEFVFQSFIHQNVIIKLLTTGKKVVVTQGGGIGCDNIDRYINNNKLVKELTAEPALDTVRDNNVTLGLESFNKTITMQYLESRIQTSQSQQLYNLLRQQSESRESPIYKYLTSLGRFESTIISVLNAKVSEIGLSKFFDELVFDGHLSAESAKKVLEKNEEYDNQKLIIEQNIENLAQVAEQKTTFIIARVLQNFIDQNELSKKIVLPEEWEKKINESYHDYKILGGWSVATVWPLQEVQHLIEIGEIK